MNRLVKGGGECFTEFLSYISSHVTFLVLHVGDVNAVDTETLNQTASLLGNKLTITAHNLHPNCAPASLWME